MKEFRITATGGKFDPASVPSHIKENIAQVVYTSALQAWNDPAVREAYECWKAERKARASAK